MPHGQYALNDKMIQSISKDIDKKLRKGIDFFRLKDESIYSVIETLSILIAKKPNRRYVEEFFKICTYNNYISMYERKFLLERYTRISFTFPHLVDSEIQKLFLQGFHRNIKEFEENIGFNFEFIPKEARHSNRAMVVTSQFLSIAHSPTNVVLSTCKELIKKMGMQVCLINTAELMANIYEQPFYNDYRPSYVAEYNNCSQISYDDCDIHFFQCQKPMPNAKELLKILSFVQEHRPDFILSIGSSFVTAELCNKIVPVVTIPLTAYGLPFASTRFLTLLGRKLRPEDHKLMTSLNVNEKNILDDIVLSISIPRQTKQFTRKDFKLPQEAFLLAIAGNRLDTDIIAEVATFLHSFADLNIHIVFIGEFANFSEFTNANPKLMPFMTYIGHQQDFLAAIEICDLFVNPKRQGNGSIALMAMLKKVPIVTFPGNDVAALLEGEFFVNSYEEMKTMINRYMSDKEFYHKLSLRAFELANIQLDKSLSFVEKIIGRMRESPLY